MGRDPRGTGGAVCKIAGIAYTGSNPVPATTPLSCGNAAAAVRSGRVRRSGFPPDVIVVAVRWYLRFGLSYRDVEELLTERGVEVDHVTVYRWVIRFTALLADTAKPCRHAVGRRWQVDETCVKVAGQWRYAYRAIDQFGQVIDVFVSARRDAKAARRFFERAIGATKLTPVKVCYRSGAGVPGLAGGIPPGGVASN